MKELIFLETIIKKKIWGEERWVVSANREGDCKIRNKMWEGKTLSQLWDEHPELFGRVKKEQFPLLVKVIQAKEDLSIQVHPDDEYAKRHEKETSGKNECWYILGCENKASLIVGHTASDKGELVERIQKNEWEKLLREVAVKKGDFVKIDAGTLHAIKGGITLLEVQQNAAITYRVYDYERRKNGKPRELHTKKAVDVMTVPAQKIEKCVYSSNSVHKNQMQRMGGNHSYEIFKVCISKKFEMIQKFPFLILSVVWGEGSINGIKIARGDHFIVPFAYGNMEFEGEMEVICSIYPHSCKENMEDFNKI